MKKYNRRSCESNYSRLESQPISDCTKEPLSMRVALLLNMPKAGLEPARGCPHKILSLARLPISSLRHDLYSVVISLVMKLVDLKFYYLRCRCGLSSLRHAFLEKSLAKNFSHTDLLLKQNSRMCFRKSKQKDFRHLGLSYFYKIIVISI